MLSLYPILCSLIKGYAYFPFQLVLKILNNNNSKTIVK